MLSVLVFQINSKNPKFTMFDYISTLEVKWVSHSKSHFKNFLLIINKIAGLLKKNILIFSSFCYEESCNAFNQGRIKGGGLTRTVAPGPSQVPKWWKPIQFYDFIVFKKMLLQLIFKITIFLHFNKWSFFTNRTFLIC